MLASGNVLQFALGSEAGILRNIYNQGALEIAATRADMIARSVPEDVIAKTLADMRFNHAMGVRRTGSAMMRRAAKLFDSARRQARPTY